MILLERGQSAEAATQFRAALAVQPGFADGHFGLAKALFHQGKAAEALPEIEQGIEIDQGREQAHYLRYQILKTLEREADAEKERAKFKELKTKSAQ